MEPKLIIRNAVPEYTAASYLVASASADVAAVSLYRINSSVFSAFHYIPT